MHSSADSVARSGAEPMILAALRRSEFSVHRYRVWGAEKQYKDVDAATAGEAVRCSGMERVTKVEHLHVRMPVVIDGDALEYDEPRGAAAYSVSTYLA